MEINSHHSCKDGKLKCIRVPTQSRSFISSVVLLAVIYRTLIYDPLWDNLTVRLLPANVREEEERLCKKMLQPLLTLHSQELLLCGPTRVHLRGRLTEGEREAGGKKEEKRGVKMTT